MKLTEEQARAVLRRQVEEMMKDLTVIALEKLETLIKSGAGIVEKQIETTEWVRDETWGCAKDFMVAFLSGQPDLYRRPHETRDDRKRIKNYTHFI